MTLRRSLCIAALTGLLFSFYGCSGGSSSSDSLDADRDALGVWEVTGGDLDQVFRQVGIEVATDRLWQLELFRATGRGELANLFGSDFLDSDIFVRTVGYSEEELQLAFNSLDPELRDLLQAYVDGINERVREVLGNPELRPGEFLTLGVNPTQWTVTDVLAWMVQFLRTIDPEAFFTGQIENVALLQELTDKFAADAQAMFEDLRWLNAPDARTMIPSGEDPEPAPAFAEGPDPLFPHADDFPDLRETALRIRDRLERFRASLDAAGVPSKLGSQAWAVAGSRTQSGQPFVFSGPELGFEAPAMVAEGSIRGGGIDVSGMVVPGIPGFLVGRTDAFAWSVQTGHAHTVDYFLEPGAEIVLDREELIQVLDGDDVTIEVYRSPRGPVIDPMPYMPPLDGTVWSYSHWGFELAAIRPLLEIWRAQTLEDFGDALQDIPVSLHVTYAGADGNIAYFMTGRDPVRPEEADPRFVQVSEEPPAVVELKPRPESTNPGQGYFGGWNDKASAESMNAPNSVLQQFGPFRRGHVIDEALAASEMASFEELRDLHASVSTTDGVGAGGNPYSFIREDFEAAVMAMPTPERMAAIDLLAGFNGRFIDGTFADWIASETLSDAWVLQNAWIFEVLRLVFEDELETANLTWEDQSPEILFNVLLHSRPGAALPNQFDWFQDTNGRGIPTDPAGIYVLALDNVLAVLGEAPFEVERSEITFDHPVFNEEPIDTSLFFRRATYAQAVEMGGSGPARAESLAPLGQDGFIEQGEFELEFGENFFSRQDSWEQFSFLPMD